MAALSNITVATCRKQFHVSVDEGKNGDTYFCSVAAVKMCGTMKVLFKLTLKSASVFRLSHSFTSRSAPAVAKKLLSKGHHEMELTGFE